MTLLAGHFCVQAGEGIPRFGMVEVFGGFPVFRVVALGTFIAQLALMRIGVTGLAKRGKPEIRFGQILILDQGAIRGRHVRRRVAILAGQGGVLAFQGVAGEAMIKFLP